MFIIKSVKLLVLLWWYKWSSLPPSHVLINLAYILYIPHDKRFLFYDVIFLHPRFAERSSLLVGHPAFALCRLHAKMWEWSSWAAQPESVSGYTSAMQYRGPGKRLAQLPHMWQIPCGLPGTQQHALLLCNILWYLLGPFKEASLFTARLEVSFIKRSANLDFLARWMHSFRAEKKSIK